MFVDTKNAQDHYLAQSWTRYLTRQTSDFSAVATTPPQHRNKVNWNFCLGGLDRWLLCYLMQLNALIGWTDRKKLRE